MTELRCSNSLGGAPTAEPCKHKHEQQWNVTPSAHNHHISQLPPPPQLFNPILSYSIAFNTQAAPNMLSTTSARCLSISFDLYACTATFCAMDLRKYILELGSLLAQFATRDISVHLRRLGDRHITHRASKGATGHRSQNMHIAHMPCKH